MALIVPGGISRAQARRVIPPDRRVDIFATCKDALGWLDADDCAAAGGD